MQNRSAQHPKENSLSEEVKILSLLIKNLDKVIHLFSKVSLDRLVFGKVRLHKPAEEHHVNFQHIFKSIQENTSSAVSDKENYEDKKKRLINLYTELIRLLELFPGQHPHQTISKHFVQLLPLTLFSFNLHQLYFFLEIEKEWKDFEKLMPEIDLRQIQADIANPAKELSSIEKKLDDLSDYLLEARDLFLKHKFQQSQRELYLNIAEEIKAIHLDDTLSYFKPFAQTISEENRQRYTVAITDLKMNLISLPALFSTLTPEWITEEEKKDELIQKNLDKAQTVVKTLQQELNQAKENRAANRVLNKQDVNIQEIPPSAIKNAHQAQLKANPKPAPTLGQSISHFLKKHWWRILLGALFVATIVALSVFTFGGASILAGAVLSAAAATGTGLSMATATGIGVSSAIVCGAAVGAGMGVAAGAKADRQEAKLKMACKRAEPKPARFESTHRRLNIRLILGDGTKSTPEQRHSYAGSTQLDRTKLPLGDGEPGNRPKLFQRSLSLPDLHDADKQSSSLSQSPR